MNWIQNVSAIDFQNGNHFDCGENSMGIQICDPCGWVPTPKYQFKELHKFEFLDLEDGDDYVDDFGCSDEEAKALADLLQRAYVNKMNVVVHCTAGVCRSGAITEVGIMMGFIDTEAYRQPNVRVKTKMMKALGLGYDEESHDLTDDASIINLCKGM